MKKCPYCAESIQDEAKKCKECNEFLNFYRRALNTFVILVIPFLSLLIAAWQIQSKDLVQKNPSRKQAVSIQQYKHNPLG